MNFEDAGVETFSSLPPPSRALSYFSASFSQLYSSSSLRFSVLCIIFQLSKHRTESFFVPELLFPFHHKCFENSLLLLIFPYLSRSRPTIHHHNSIIIIIIRNNSIYAKSLRGQENENTIMKSPWPTTREFLLCIAHQNKVAPFLSALFFHPPSFSFACDWFVPTTTLLLSL